MLFNIALLVTAAAAVPAVAAAESKGYILMDLQSSTNSNLSLDRYQRQLKRRDGSIEMDLTNLASYYQIKVSLGTPAQDVLLTVDTGSSDLWVLSSSSDECEAGHCTTSTSFDESKSSSFQGNTSNPFGISYGDGTSAKGYWSQDTITLNGQQLHGGNFALATTTSSNLPVFGIGLTAGETAKTKYDNVPIQLQKQGLIKTVAYSLWLNDIDAMQGSLLFGGVDHSKYVGELLKVPMVNDGQITLSGTEATSLSIMMHGVAIYTPDGFEADILSTSLATLLDSGTTLSYLPTDMVKAIGQAANATWSNSLDMNLLPCDVDGGMTFDFSGIQIRVPFHQMLLNIKSSDGSQVTLDNGKEACALGIQGWAKNQYILGDTVLRGCYTVFDLQNKEVALAPINYSPSSANVEAIDGSIPSASPAASYSSTSTGTGFSSLQLKFTAIPDATSAPSSDASSSASATSSDMSSLASPSASVELSSASSSASSSDMPSSSDLPSSTQFSSTDANMTSVDVSSYANSTLITSSPSSFSSSTASSTSAASSSTSAAASSTSEASATNKKKNGAAIQKLSASLIGTTGLVLLLFAF